MNKMLFLIGLTLAALQGSASAEDAKRSDSLITATYVISGLHCPPCARTVESSLTKVKGIRAAKVAWATKSAQVQFDEATISAQQVAEIITHTPHMMGGGMHYAGSFALSVPAIGDQETGKAAQEALRGISGVAKVNVFPSSHTLTVQFAQDAKVRSAQLIEALDKAGMKARTY